MDLLRLPVRPLGRDVIGGELDSDPGLTVHGHQVEIVVTVVDRTPQHSGPEVALGGRVGRVEHDDLMVDLHAANPHPTP